MRNGFLDALFPAITRLGDGGAVWIAVALIFIGPKKYRADGITLISALLLCVLVGNICLKPLIARVRPCEINTAVSLLIPRPTDYSFPSGHAMSSFAAATVVFYRNKRMGVCAILLAAVIAFSRLYLYVHYPSDILGGIAIGIALGIFTLFIRTVIIKKTGRI